MVNSDEVVFCLKDNIKNFRGETEKDLSGYPVGSQISPKEFKDAPDMTMGLALALILTRFVKADNRNSGVESVNLHRLAVKIFNSLETAKGELHVKEKDVDEFIEYLKRCTAPPNKVGPIMDKLDSLKAEFTKKRDSK